MGLGRELGQGLCRQGRYLVGAQRSMRTQGRGFWRGLLSVICRTSNTGTERPASAPGSTALEVEAHKVLAQVSDFPFLFPLPLQPTPPGRPPQISGGQEARFQPLCALAPDSCSTQLLGALGVTGGFDLIQAPK